MMESYGILKDVSRIPIIANIPHSSLFIPPDIRQSFLISNADVEKELLLLTDRYVDELFLPVYEMGGIIIRYNISRMVVDPERFENDEEEEMSKVGMGVIYVKTSDGKSLRNSPNQKGEKVLLERFYRPYHKAIEQEVNGLLERFERCLILDCHSFSSTPLPFEPDRTPERPDICIGTNNFHTPVRLVESIENYFNNIPFKTIRNKPYEGTYVPLSYLNKEERVFSVMIEINRRLYMDESTGEKNSSFIKIKAMNKELITRLSVWFEKPNS